MRKMGLKFGKLPRKSEEFAALTGQSSARKALSYDEMIAKFGPVRLEIFDKIRQTTT